MKFENIKKDYEKLMDQYGVPEDMTGAFVDSESMEKVIRNPNKKNAGNYMKDVISFGFQDGKFWNTECNGKIPIYSNPFLKRCYDEYVSISS